VIFESSVKSDGRKLVPLTTAEVKQIGGRAGRFRTSHQAITAPQDQVKAQDDEQISDNSNLDIGHPPQTSGVRGTNDSGNSSIESSPAPSNPQGLVTTFDDFDYPAVKKKMHSDPDPLMTAGIFPPDALIQRFANYFPPETPFSYILMRFQELARIHPRFHLCALNEQVLIADCIHEVQDLTVMDRLIFCASPAGIRKWPNSRGFVRALAQCVADQRGGGFLELPGLELELLDQTSVTDLRQYLERLEGLHKNIVLYLWLSYRFNGVFTSRPLANHTKGLVEEAIDRCLNEMQLAESDWAQLRKKRQAKIMRFSFHGAANNSEATKGDDEHLFPINAKRITNETAEGKEKVQYIFSGENAGDKANEIVTEA
jgi:ATP-dependent RNA helicase SUPV3L1/SUV3